jgi:nucleoside-diphosphate-sugar epimerase
MRIVVVGATGNHGTSLCRRLSADPDVDAVVGVARRRPELSLPKVSWQTLDVTRDDLEPVLRGADAVVSLVWLIQPGRRESVTKSVNVDGSARVFEATARAGVPVLVYASSVGAYGEGPKDRAVDESWSTAGIPTSFYSRHKAAVERILDSFEAAHPSVRVVRMRPGLTFKREAATQIRRLFAGPFLPGSLLRPALIPLVPSLDRLRFQAVHTDDLAEAYRLALVTDSARGAYNVAADPVLDPETLAAVLSARRLRVPARCCAPAPPPRTRCASSRPSRAGSTWGSASRSWTRRGSGPSSGGSRGTPPSRRSRSCSRACARARGSTRRRSTRRRAGRCASARSSPVSGAPRGSRFPTVPQEHLDRLTAVDASFLEQETPESHMHVGALVTLEGPAPALADFLDLLRGRLHLVPRYRQKLAVPPLEAGRPLWVDDPDFNLEYHVRHTALPSPGSEEQLRNLAPRILPRSSRPLQAAVGAVDRRETSTTAGGRSITKDPPRAHRRHRGRRPGPR